ncbi:ylmH protein, partial [Acinetobacter baumannii ABNIH3]
MSHFFGGPHAERKRAIIAPLYFKPQPEDFELTLFELQYPK